MTAAHCIRYKSVYRGIQTRYTFNVFLGVDDAYGYKRNLNEHDVRDFGTQHSKVDWSESESKKHVKNWRKKGDVFIHEDYNSDPQHSYVNDIALIKLDKNWNAGKVGWFKYHERQHNYTLDEALRKFNFVAWEAKKRAAIKKVIEKGKTE